jgi:DNA-directed RNA polymerase subunit RPC12/RpoP
MKESSENSLFICATCGTQYAPSAEPPLSCAICSDERQFIAPTGQRWTTLDMLREKHANVFTPEEPAVHSIHTNPAFAIGERALLIQSKSGNVLWDCVSLVDQATVDTVEHMGGIHTIAISHPHYYTTMVEWSLAFKNAAIYIHEADRSWVQRAHENVTFWSGSKLQLHDGFTLIHTPGHFDGFQVLHWPVGAGGQGVLFSGDQPQVCMDTNWVSFMYSYPNFVPLGANAVQNICRTLEDWHFDRIYGAFPGRTVWGGAKQKIAASADRYLKALA